MSQAPLDTLVMNGTLDGLFRRRHRHAFEPSVELPVLTEAEVSAPDVPT